MDHQKYAAEILPLSWAFNLINEAFPSIALRRSFGTHSHVRWHEKNFTAGLIAGLLT